MTLRTIVAVAAATLLAAGSAAAQTADTAAATPRNNSFSFGLGPSTRVGLWHRFSPRVQAGVEVFARGESTDTEGEDLESTLTQFGVAPGIKLYRGPIGPVLPYVFVGADASFGRGRNEFLNSAGDVVVATQEFSTFGGSLGVGVDWFPVERVSVGGHAMVQAHWTRSESENAGTTFPEQHSSSIGTLSSGLRVHFYF